MHPGPRYRRFQRANERGNRRPHAGTLLPANGPDRLSLAHLPVTTNVFQLIHNISNNDLQST